MDLRYIVLAVASAFTVLDVRAEQRLPTVPPAQYSPQQRQAAVDFEGARKVPVFGPFEPMMHSPQVMSSARQMGDYLRYKSAIGNTLSELMILVTAREWTQEYEWYLHYPIALKAGIRREIIDSIAAGRRPAAMSSDEQIVYDYATELLRRHQISDTAFERAKSRFGTKGIVDMTGSSVTTRFWPCSSTPLSTRSQGKPKSYQSCPLRQGMIPIV